MGSPAETVGLSAVLVTVTSAHRTRMNSSHGLGLPALVVVTTTMFETVPLGQGPVAPVVGLVTWTEVVAPAARSAGPKPSTPALMAQPGSELAMFLVRSVLVRRVSDTLFPCTTLFRSLWTVTV